MNDVPDSGPVSPILTADIKGLLQFFDKKPGWSVGHATGVVGIVGEDLNAACFQRYVAEKGGSATVLRNPDTGRPLPVTMGRSSGPRLDRWIRVDWPDKPVTVFQTEIKSWSAHAISGRSLSVSASQDELARYRQSRWERRWDSEARRLKHSLMSKVLEPMNPPGCVKDEVICPLLIFWEALGPPGSSDEHFFKVEVDAPAFQELWVFSVSSYLRGLLSEGIAEIDLEMPDAALRLRTVNRLFSG